MPFAKTNFILFRFANTIGFWDIPANLLPVRPKAGMAISITGRENRMASFTSLLIALLPFISAASEDIKKVAIVKVAITVATTWIFTSVFRLMLFVLKERRNCDAKC